MTDDERIERDLHEVFSRRDPGPAPERLRARVGDISLVPPPGRTWLLRVVGVARPLAATVVTAAAIVVGILIVSVVRPGPGPSAGQSPGPGSIGAGATPDLGTVGAPVALPFGIAALAVLLVVLVPFGLADASLERAARRAPEAVPRRGVRRLAGRAPRRWLVLGTILALIGGLTYVARDTRLAQGNVFQVSLVHLEGIGQVPSTGADTGRQGAYFRYVPGGTVTIAEAVLNAGHLPVTITGNATGDPGIELRLFASPDSPDSADAPTYPFAPIELAPGQERSIAIVFHLGACPGIAPPSNEPSPDLSGGYVPPTADGSAFMTFDSVDLFDSALGLAQQDRVPFFEPVVIRSPIAVVCSLDQEWARPSPSAP